VAAYRALSRAARPPERRLVLRKLVPEEDAAPAGSTGNFYPERHFNIGRRRYEIAKEHAGE